MAWQWKTWHRVVLGLMIFLVLVVSLLPIIARYVIIDQLEKTGVEQVQLDDVDINLLVGKVGLTGLSAHYQGQPVLTLRELRLDLSINALFSKRILVESLYIDGLFVRIHDDLNGRFLAGIPLPEVELDPADGLGEKELRPEEIRTEDAAKPWGVGVIELALHDIRVDATLQAVTTKLAIETLTLRELFSWQADWLSGLALAAQINDTPLQLGGNVQPFAQDQSYRIQLALEPFSLRPFAALVKPWLPTFDVSVSMDLLVDAVMAGYGQISVNSKGFIAMDIDELAQGDLYITDTAWRWQGELNLNLVPGVDAADITITTDAEFSNHRLKLGYSPLAFQVSHQGLTIEHQLAVRMLANSEDGLPEIQGKVQFSLQQLRVQEQPEDDADAFLVAQFERFKVTDIELAGLQQLSIASVSLSELDLLRSSDRTDSEKGVVALGSLQLLQLALRDMARLTLDQIDFNSLQVDVAHGPNGLAVIDPFLQRLNERLSRHPAGVGVEVAQASSADGHATADNLAAGEPAAEAADFHFRVGPIQLHGDNRIVFRDRNFTPPVTHRLTIETLSLSGIDSESPQTPSDLVVVVKPDQQGSLGVTGQLTPLQVDHWADLEIHLRGMQLTPMTRYAEQAIGYALNSGQLGFTSKIKIDNNILNSENQARLQRLELEPVDEEIITRVSRQISMPVSTALDLLKDRNGQITLDIPVTGALDDPQVSLRQVIQMATTQAVRRGAITYLQLALQPYGAIWMAAEYVGGRMSSFALDPVQFVPQSIDVLEGQLDYLPRIAQLLNGREALTIRLCPIVTAADFVHADAQAQSDVGVAVEMPGELPSGSEFEPDPVTAGASVPISRTSLQPQDVALARQRVSSLRTLLIEQYAINGDHLLDCRPRLGEGQPRVLLEL